MNKSDDFNSDASLLYFDIFQLAKSDSSIFLNTLNDLTVYNFNVDSRDENGNTLLHIFVVKEQPQVVKKLLEVGARPNIFNAKTETPLHLACSLNKPEMALLLLEHPSTNWAVLDKYGESPIFRAIRKNHFKLVKMIVTKNPEVLRQTSKLGDSLLHACLTRTPSIELVKFLLTFDLDVNKKNLSKLTPFQMAVKSSQKDVVGQFLLTNRVELSDPTLLHLATLQNTDNRLVRMLVNSGVIVSVTNGNGETPLHLAVGQNRASTVALLLQYDQIDVNLQDEDGYSALHVAARDSNRIGCLQLLVNSGKANLSLKTQNGNLALHLACLNDNLDAVRELYTRKMALEINNDGLNCYELALSMDNVIVAGFLKKQLTLDRPKSVTFTIDLPRKVSFKK